MSEELKKALDRIEVLQMAIQEKYKDDAFVASRVEDNLKLLEEIRGYYLQNFEDKMREIEDVFIFTPWQEWVCRKIQKVPYLSDFNRIEEDKSDKTQLTIALNKTKEAIDNKVLAYIADFEKKHSVDLSNAMHQLSKKLHYDDNFDRINASSFLSALEILVKSDKSVISILRKTQWIEDEQEIKSLGLELSCTLPQVGSLVMYYGNPKPNRLKKYGVVRKNGKCVMLDIVLFDESKNENLKVEFSVAEPNEEWAEFKLAEG